MKRREFLGASAAVGLVASAGCMRVDAAETTTSHEYDLGDDESLRVTNQEGDVTVRAGDTDVVRASLTKRDGAGNEDALSKVELGADRSDSFLELAVEDRTDEGLFHATSADLELDVPAGADLARVETDDGDVEVRDTAGDLRVEVDDGNVTATGVDGAVTANTDDGDVVVTDAGGDVSATIDDGDVTIRDPGALGSIDGDDGDVEVEIPAVTAHSSVRVDDGDATAAIATDLDVTITVETDDGDVEVDEAFGVEATGEVDRLTFTLGSGENSLRIRADDGDVDLRALD